MVVPQDHQTGTRVHTLLAHYAVNKLRPEPESIAADVASLISDHPIESRFHVGAARIITATAVGVQHLPPVEIPCIGVEVPLDGARADSMWELVDGGLGFGTPGGRLVLEVTCTSDLRRLRGAARYSQITRELIQGIVSDEPFAGVSLLNLSYPPSSLFFTPELGPDHPLPLLETPFWFRPRPIIPTRNGAHT